MVYVFVALALALIYTMYRLGYSRGYLNATVDAANDYGEIINGYKRALTAYVEAVEKYKIAIKASREAQSGLLLIVKEQHQTIVNFGKKQGLKLAEDLDLPAELLQLPEVEPLEEGSPDEES